MKDQFVPYEIAERLKEVGFDEPCMAFYYSEKSDPFNEKFELCHFPKQTPGYCAAPTWQQVEEWLWNTQQIKVHIKGFDVFTIFVYDADHDEIYRDRSENFISPIIARREGILQAVNVLYERKKRLDPMLNKIIEKTKDK